MPSFLDLPRELRDQIYQSINADYRPEHHPKTECHIRLAGASRYTSAITAVCRQIHDEYQTVANGDLRIIKLHVDSCGFKAPIEYFHRYFAKDLTTLQRNNVRLDIKYDYLHMHLDSFYELALFHIKIKLEVDYKTTPEMWSPSASHFRRLCLRLHCVIEERTSQEIRDNMPEIRRIALDFDLAVRKDVPEMVSYYIAVLKPDDPTMPWNN